VPAKEFIDTQVLEVAPIGDVDVATADSYPSQEFAKNEERAYVRQTPANDGGEARVADRVACANVEKGHVERGASLVTCLVIAAQMQALTLGTRSGGRRAVGHPQGLC